MKRRSLNLVFLQFSEESETGRMHKMTWRFLVLGDPTVRKFASRDLDSQISGRERDAVRQWENSEFLFHGMRDHPHHYAPILGGMWGGDNCKIGMENAKNLQKEIINVRFQS